MNQMTKDEVLKLALEALENCYAYLHEDEDIPEAITAIKEALAAPVQEPVGYADSRDLAKDGNWDTLIVKHASEMREGLRFNIPLYTTPPAAQRQWTGLTDEELEAIPLRQPNGYAGFARAIEAKLKEKNT